jgi:serine O-acetyltransferase
MPELARDEDAAHVTVGTHDDRRDPDAATRRFFFIHLMKTGGTSFAFHLQRQFDGSEIYPAKGIDRRDEYDIASYVSISRMLRLSPERRAEIRMFTGHFPFVASELLGLDLVTLTLLRHPVDRTISVLKHFKRLSKRYKEFELAQIYEDPFVFAHFVENHQTRMFSVTAADAPEAFGSKMSYWATASLLGVGVAREDIDVSDVDRERAIAAAKESMVDESRFALALEQLKKVDVIGFSERYDEFIDELRERFGWWPSGLSTKARANESSEGWSVPDELRARIAHDNAFDVQLYEYAERLVAERRAQELPAPTETVVTSVRPASGTTSGPTTEPALAAALGLSPERLRAGILAKHPRFFEAVVTDARVAASYRAERSKFRGRADALRQVLRLMWVSDAFLALVLYRAKARMQARGVPVLPTIAHRLSMAVADVCIGDPVVMQPGVYLAHGQVVIDGFVEIGRDVVIFPWVTIGLRAGELRGPTIGNRVHVGTGAKVIGPVTVHDGARIGANAVVVDDVPTDATVVGAPARPVGGPRTH